nr:MAG TPA: hypothetical protein [Caudoviricetes sp.]
MDRFIRKNCSTITWTVNYFIPAILFHQIITRFHKLFSPKI